MLGRYAMRAASLLLIFLMIPACARDEIQQPRIVTKVVTKTVIVAPYCPRKTTCREMTSCAEAAYHFTTCHQYQLDRNNNLIPCEKDWCGSSTDEMAKRIRQNPFKVPTSLPSS